ncbi:alpha/beta fold hydrolase [Spirosoma endbachense]|uniref:Alpha/beta fold hydrolase n=1 Tax=Spirosoma endbachense TaxID=2666025 RepID=A0A6P1W6Q3_9BACT|nr:alpha/beta hydrolase [Spirosoma endbachense]QHW01014.1 alpha/beta fold hydrolase [Spirosoma endbachense]
MKKGLFKWIVSSLIISVLSVSGNCYGQAVAKTKNIILVHGAFVDGSGWLEVYHILARQGYRVAITQHPMTSFQADVAAVTRLIDQQDGPCVLVGHSYGGAIITTAGNNPKVAGLVYIAAHAPDVGETEADNGKAYPPAYKSLIKGSDGLDYIDPGMFSIDFAPGVSNEIAGFMAVSQPAIADQAFHAVIQTPSWKTKPVWYMVAKSDRIINPDLERMYAKRANSIKTVEVDGAGHCIYMTHPKEAAALIVLATQGK